MSSSPNQVRIGSDLSVKGCAYLRQIVDELFCVGIFTGAFNKRSFDVVGSEFMLSTNKSILDVPVDGVVEEERFLLDQA